MAARTAFLIVITYLTFASTPARAEPEPEPAASESDELIERALQLRENGRDAEALRLLERAFALDPRARPRAQLALAQQAVGNWADAERGLTTALADATEPWIAMHRAILEKALATVRRHLGWIDLETSPAGASVTLDGAPAGGLPLGESLRVLAGAHQVHVDATGYAGAGRSVEVLAGQHAHVAIALTRLVQSMPIGKLLPASDVDAGSSRRTWGWITLGGAGLALVEGVVATAVRGAHVANYNDDSRCPPGRRLAMCGGERDMADTAGVFAGVGFGLAAVMAVTGTVLVLTSPKSAVRVAAWGTPGGAGIGIGRGF